jgi:hypothetical protein
MPMAVTLLDLATVPIWALWIFAVVGLTCIFGAALWILPPRLRRRYPAVILFGTALFCTRAAVSRDPRGVLWFGGLLGMACLTLLSMGQMPADMPSARDPAVREHPLYSVVARRGRIAGISLVIAVVALVVLSVVFVRGV